MNFREHRLVDYSSARPGIRELRAAGADGVARYLTRSTGPKRLLLPEAQQLLAAGLSITLVFEDTADRARQGHAAGVADATEANRQARSLGLPADCPIFYAVDFETGPAPVKDYFIGISTVPGHPVGAYGDIAVVDGIMGDRLALYGWQASAWSHHAVSKKAHLYQRQTATHPVPGTDENLVLRSFPTWTAQRRAPAPAPAPAPHVITPPLSHEEVQRMLVQFKGGHAVWEVVGSKLMFVSAVAWHARGLKTSQLNVLPVDHPLASLEKVTS